MRTKAFLARSPEGIKEIILGPIYQPATSGLGNAQPRYLLSVVKSGEPWCHNYLKGRKPAMALRDALQLITLPSIVPEPEEAAGTEAEKLVA